MTALNGMMSKRSSRTPECPWCDDATETTEHFLMGCQRPQAVNLREKLLQQIEKECTCRPTKKQEEGNSFKSCFEFFSELASHGLQVFILGGPVDDHPPDKEVDKACRQYVGDLCTTAHRNIGWS